MPQLDALIGLRLDVLDDGFVRLIDYMGCDAAVVQAARVSYGEGTKHTSDDRALIRYLMRHMHTTPFEMCELKLHVRVPMDTWRQWIRHRTASVNEYSTRYSIAIDAAQKTPLGKWRTQSDENRQGSASLVTQEIGSRLSDAESDLQAHARAVYEERIAAGIAREQARKDLPLSTYTEAYWKIDLHNLLHFLELRMHEHAQEEIRAYACLIGNQIVANWVPQVWSAFLEYRMNGLRLSSLDTAIAGALFKGDLVAAKRLAENAGFLERRADGTLKVSRERRELDVKLAKLGLNVDWKK